MRIHRWSARRFEALVAMGTVVGPLLVGTAWGAGSPIGTKTERVIFPAGANAEASAILAVDINRDTFVDVLVGASSANNGAGRVYVYLGRANGFAPPVAIEGTVAGARFGAALAAVGDTDGDGFADVAVGAPAFSGGEAGEGAVYVYAGSAAGLVTAPKRVESNVVGAGFGASIAAVGDFNKDNLGDFMVGAPRQASDTGRVYVVRGAAVAFPPLFTIDSPDVGIGTGLFGASVASVGDLDGDGVAEVAVGAPKGAGKAYLFTLAGVETGAPLRWSFTLNQPGAEVGFSVAGVGDVNKDGLPDLAIGAPGTRTPNGFQQAGAVLVFHGTRLGMSLTPDTAILSRSPFSAEFARFGESVAGAGDVNGDGYRDLVVGYGQGVESAAVFPGSCSGVVATNLIPGRVDQGLKSQGTIVPIRPWTSAMLRTVSSADIDKDGLSDLLFMTPDGFGVNAFWDTDLDGITDDDETFGGLDPKAFDSDGDGCADGTELFYSSDRKGGAARDPKIGKCFTVNFGESGGPACPSVTAPLAVRAGPVRGSCVPCGRDADDACSGVVGAHLDGRSNACPKEAPTCVKEGPEKGSCLARCDGAFGSTAKNACRVSKTPVCEKDGFCRPCDGSFGAGTPRACPSATSPLCSTTGPLAGSCISPDSPDAGAGDAGGTGNSGLIPRPEDGSCVCSLGAPAPGSAGALLTLAPLLALVAVLRRRGRTP